MPAITTALIASAAIGGIANMIGGKQQGDMLRRQGEAMAAYYKSQAKFNKVETGRKARAAVGSAQVNADARGVEFSGSTLESAFSDIYDFELQEAFKRQQAKAQGVLSQGRSDFSAAQAYTSAATAPIDTANSIFSALDRKFPETGS